MTNVLILDQHSAVADLVAQKLKKIPNIKVTRLTGIDFKRAKSYVPVLRHQNIIASFLGPMGVDLDFEALFDAVSLVVPPIHQFLMMSHAGIDDEVTGPAIFPDVKNVPEYLNEQRYAVKVVDESEIPYTILRPVTITKQPAITEPRIIEEGQSVNNGTVSYQNVAQIAVDVIVGRRYLNQSVAIIDQK